MKNGKPFPVPVRAAKPRVQYSCLKCPGYCCSYPEIEVTPRDIERLAKHFGVSYEQAEESFTKYDPKEKVRLLRHQKDKTSPSTCMMFDRKAPLHRVRGAPGGVPRVPGQPAVRLLRIPQVRARPPGRRGLHRLDLSALALLPRDRRELRVGLGRA